MNSPNANMDNQSKKQHTSLHHRLSFWIIILLLISILFSLHEYKIFKAKYTTTTQAQPVEAVKANTQDVPIYLFALGNVVPTYSVTIKTQVNGQLLKVLFKEGQMVKTGDLLAEIDDRPYQAQFTEYQGQLQRDQAQLNNALIDLKRYQTLWKQDSVSQQILATQLALVKQLQGTLLLDQGLLQAAQVNLSYTKITSPIDGRIGLRLVDAGNIVQTTDTTGLAIINLLNPITVIFTIAEDNIPNVLQQIKVNKTLAVVALDRQQNKELASGTLLTIDNQINTNTGTVRLKAQFKNENNILFPNQFVNIKLLLKTLHNATVIPTSAIQFSPQGSYVYIVNADQTVSAKTVITSVTINENTAITTGVSPGQLVVTEGADKLTDGMKVMTESKTKTSPSQTVSNKA